MANKIILQPADNGNVDILVKHEGYPSDHYVQCPPADVDHYVKMAGGDIPGVELVDLRKPKYNLKQIAWELERTAMGDSYYGNALLVAKDLPGISPEDRALLGRWADGRQKGVPDRTALCELAMRLHNS